LAQPIPVGDGAALLARRPDVGRRNGVGRRYGAHRRGDGGPLSPDHAGRIGRCDGTGRRIRLPAGRSRWLLGPLINWSFPNQEPVRARIAAAKADSAASLAQFDGTVLRALEETERALASYSHALEREQTLAAARDAAARAAAISVARQREGRIDFLTLLDAQRTWQAPRPISQRPSARWRSRRWTCSARGRGLGSGFTAARLTTKAPAPGRLRGHGARLVETSGDRQIDGFGARGGGRWRLGDDRRSGTSRVAGRTDRGADPSRSACSVLGRKGPRSER
jgi:hypothetical protein